MNEEIAKRHAWPFLYRVSSVVSLLAGFVFLAQLSWAFLSKLKQGLPIWLLITSSASCLICGWFFALWMQKRRGRPESNGKLSKVGQVRFDYLPSPPTAHGWQVAFGKETPPDKQLVPEFLAAQDAPISGSLCIRDKGQYAMDFTIEQVQSLANVVEYYVKPTRSGTFYLNVRVSSLDKTQTKFVWLRHVIGTGAPRRLNDKEWSLEVQGEVLEDGWTSVKLSVSDEVDQTFGKEGFVYEALSRIRIRGSLCISPISLYQIRGA